MPVVQETKTGGQPKVQHQPGLYRSSRFQASLSYRTRNLSFLWWGRTNKGIPVL